MTIYQFAFRDHPLVTSHMWGLKGGIPSRIFVLDCRVYLNSSHNEETARAHPRFEECVSAGLEMYDRHQSIAVGCYVRWMAAPVANEMAHRLEVQDRPEKVVQI